MRELGKKWMQEEHDHEKHERVMTHSLVESTGSHGTWEPLLGVWKAEHYDWDATKNYCEWAMHPSRRCQVVRWNTRNKRVEFKHDKDIDNRVVNNS